MSQQKGFTLIELVVAMLIAAILAAIAIPSYSNYVRKAHRTDAKSALLDLASLEERFFSTNNTYTSTWSDLGYSGGASAISVGSQFYSVAVPTFVPATPPTATTAGVPAKYTLTATAINDQLKDSTCRTYTLDSTGTRTASDASSTDTTSSCW
jgi:type IV pilus assembly protein PilE